MTQSRLFPRPRVLGLLAAFACLSSCSGDSESDPDSGTDSSTGPVTGDEESQDIPTAAPGKFYPLPKKLRSTAQSHEASALESIGYAAEGDEAGEFSGVMVHDEKRASKGARLYVSGHAPIATLMAPTGEVLHEWPFPPRRAFEGESLQRAGAAYIRRALMLEDGGLYAIFFNIGLVKLDRDANLIWAYEGRPHHDLDLDDQGNLWVLDREVGIVDWIHAERPILNDFVVCLSPDGEVLERLSMTECIDGSPLRDELRAETRAQFEKKLADQARVREENAELFAANPEKLALLDLPGDVFHSNTVQWLDGKVGGGEPPFVKGHVLVCIRNLGRTVIIDPATRKITWSLPGPLYPGFHEPQVLDSGEVLLFDNLGPEKREDKRGYSEVLQIDPATGETTWSYRAKRRFDFYSPIAGTCQRLPNGNTLVTSSTAGRAFEVTPTGEVVWDFLSPHRAGDDDEFVAFLPALHVVDASWLDHEED